MRPSDAGLLAVQYRRQTEQLLLLRHSASTDWTQKADNCNCFCARCRAARRPHANAAHSAQPRRLSRRHQLQACDERSAVEHPCRLMVRYLLRRNGRFAGAEIDLVSLHVQRQNIPGGHEDPSGNSAQSVGLRLFKGSQQSQRRMVQTSHASAASFPVGYFRYFSGR